MATHDYEAIGKAVVLLASLFTATAPAQVAPKAEKPQAAKDPTPADDTPSTPDPVKAEPEPAAVMSSEAFAKQAMTWAANCKDRGVKAKALLQEFGIERFSEVPAANYGIFIERQETLSLE